jgi:toxin ParE1/3/4
MRTVRRTLRADADLADIWRYTAQNWSPEQAFRYLDVIESVIAKVAQRPSLLKATPYLGKGISQVQAGSHYVFFREEQRGDLGSDHPAPENGRQTRLSDE